MKKLLFVVSGAKFFLTHRSALARSAKNVGYEVHVATPLSKWSDEISKAGFIFHPIKLDRGSLNPVKDIISCFSLWRLYRQLKPDIVHHVTLKPILYGGLIARLIKVPAVVHALTGLGYIFISQSRSIRFLRRLLRRGYKSAFQHHNMRVIFQNQDDQNQFISKKIVKPEYSVLIPGSGVCMSTFVPTDESTEIPLVILASRMLWDKGVAEFVEAARRLKTKNLEARFVLVGDVDEENPASVPKEQLDLWVNEGIIEWWGERQDMPTVMQNAHIVCLPSYREGLPRVLIEAAAAARPIVTTDTPGCRDVVRNGENGLLVPVRDSEELALAIETLLRNSALRQKMGRSGRAMIEYDYDLNRIVDQTLALYKELSP